MLLGNSLASLPPSPIASARIVALGGLGCERLASGFDYSQAVSPAHFGNARVAVPTPALEQLDRRIACTWPQPSAKSPGAECSRLCLRRDVAARLYEALWPVAILGKRGVLHSCP